MSIAEKPDLLRPRGHRTPAAAILPEPGRLRLGPPPHWRGLPGLLPISLTFMVAAGVAAGAGVVLFGWYALRVLVTSVIMSLLVESVFNVAKGRSPKWSERHALLIGLLFACTLPPTASWRVVMTGAFIAVMLGEALSGGIGNYLWHPVALGRVAVQMLFYDEMTSPHAIVLAPGRLLWGDLQAAEALPALRAWLSYVPAQAVDAVLVTPTEDLLRMPLPGHGGDAASGLTAFVRDLAPSWQDAWAAMGGRGVGEACAAAVLLAACVLAWRGLLRWQLVVAAVASAMVAAAVLPVRVETSDGGLLVCSLPGLVFDGGMPVGAAYVLSHLTAGGFLFVVLLLAPDPSSSPLTSRGHIVFGIIIGGLTIVLRVLAGLPAAAFWALLAANTAVPLIDRLTRRRVLGT